MATATRPAPAIKRIPRPADVVRFVSEHVVSVEQIDAARPSCVVRFRIGSTIAIADERTFEQAVSVAMLQHAAETAALARAPLALVDSPRHVCTWCSRPIAPSEPFTVLGGEPLHNARCLADFDSVVAGAEAR